MSPEGMASERLARECRSFAWALIGDVPTERVLAAYERAQDRPPLAHAASSLDRLLIRVGAVHPWLARLADAYAAVFARRGLFRTKLVVLLAVLESAAPHHTRFERAPTSPFVAWARLGLSGLAASLCLIGGILLFGPPHLVGALLGRGGRTPDKRPPRPARGVEPGRAS